jgi:carbon-monoxide dehydrogenase small subunit
MTDRKARGSGHEQSRTEVSLTVNGERRTVRAHPMERLLDTLRRRLGLTGAKEGCGEGECGSCSVLMDGVLVNSCLVPVLQARNTNVVTIEGLAADSKMADGRISNGKINDLQESFLQCGGAQCGICTPGMILASAHLLQKNPQPTIDEIREALSGNLCRCTGYMQIFEAVLDAARRRAVP